GRTWGGRGRPPGVSNIVRAGAIRRREGRRGGGGTLARLDRECLSLARSIAGRRKLKVVAEPLSRTEPARCAPRVMQAVVAACATLKLRHRQMPAGAGPPAPDPASGPPGGGHVVPPPAADR